MKKNMRTDLMDMAHVLFQDTYVALAKMSLYQEGMVSNFYFHLEKYPFLREVKLEPLLDKMYSSHICHFTDEILCLLLDIISPDILYDCF